MNFYSLLSIGALAWLAASYLPTGVALLNLKFSFAFFHIEKIEENRIQAVVSLRAHNGSGRSILLQNLKGSITLNGITLGHYETFVNVTIPAKHQSIIPVRFAIDKNVVGKELWRMIISNQTEFKFSLAGPVKANDKTYPLAVSWTTHDIVELINTPTING